MRNLFRFHIGPLILILLCPPTVLLMWFLNCELEGSFSALLSLFQEIGFFQGIYFICAPLFFGTATAWKIIGIFAATQLLLMRLIPGKPFHGPRSPQGNIPIYKANGVACFCITMALFLFLTEGIHLFSGSIIYDNLGGIFGALNLFSLIFCFFLYFKGRFFPSSSDFSTTGHFTFDYYWGTELYPRIAGFDIKMFTNCRFGMMSWGLIALSYAAAQRDLYGLSDGLVVSVLLQLLFIFKFFLWETGYLASLDIMHDRAGFYICWGCLVWVPCIYTSPGMYMVHNPVHLGTPLAVAILAAGAGCLLMNYLADTQRQSFRRKEGKCTIWGREPKVTRAPYTTGEGEKRESLLLGSGWWGLARHFHYIPEIGAAFFWSLPALFTSFIPYFYVTFLTALLLERAYRDDRRCAKKYGEAWEEHCKKVPYKIFPGLF